LKLIDIEIKDLHGKPVDWNSYKGKKILFVNVASECGFTPQYAQMQELSEYKPDQLAVIGIPCNDFGGQEPGTAKEIESFCQRNYGVSFLITEKVNIIQEPHPIIEYLCQVNGEAVKIDWNFNKFLVDESGTVLNHFKSPVSPLDEAILNQLN